MVVALAEPVLDNQIDSPFDVPFSTHPGHNQGQSLVTDVPSAGLFIQVEKRALLEGIKIGEHGLSAYPFKG
jgi:hypothetical protein